MLGELLDWVFGEDTEATANDAAGRQILINGQKSRERPSSLPFPCLPALIGYFLISAAGTSSGTQLKAIDLCGTARVT